MPQPQPEYRVHLECHTSGPTGGKFWSAEVNGSKAIVRWGPRGKPGQSKEYQFGNTAAAVRFVENKEDEKKGKGYFEVSRLWDPLPAAQPKTSPPEPPTVQSITFISNEALSWDF